MISFTQTRSFSSLKLYGHRLYTWVSVIVIVIFMGSISIGEALKKMF